MQNCLADDLLPFYITLTHHRWGAFLLGSLEEKIVSYPFLCLRKREFFYHFIYKTEGEHHSQGCKSPIHHMVYDSVRRPKTSVNSQIHKQLHVEHILPCTCVLLTYRGNKPHLLVDASGSGRLTC